ncbi:hypothetical protein RIR_jg10965.t1 [Rhizophagus irregularis DAOM 181602=DAOM 197198]|nr:hypothetical protein RIR_jg1170.t1 [Rhizophagus irregularis DAOM 181602=DAOM 197198]GET61050.1 hypothetical protein RIR_jg10965.t1 [Rhizophagus irregularis DAOM 181602=DAOM 197198]
MFTGFKNAYVKSSAIIDNIRRLPSGVLLFIIIARIKQSQKIRVWFGICRGLVWRNPDLYNMYNKFSSFL